jgi:ABC-type amino acid transport substrate-binding protein
MRKFVLIVMFSILTPLTADAASVLESIKQNGIIKIGYRTNTPPFSYKNEIGEAAGFTVNLCRSVAAIIGTRFKRSISITYVPVTAKNRFDAVRARKVDLLCGATTETLSRRKLVQFSVATYVTGASVIYRSDGPSNFRDLVGHKIGVVSGTTTERDLASTLKQLKIKAHVVRYRNHENGLQALKLGQADAYFGDRAILTGLLKKTSNASVGLTLSNHHFSVEPYALAMPLGSNRFRDEVDRALSKIYKSGGLMKIFRNSFGNAEPSNFMKALVVINALSD